MSLKFGWCMTGQHDDCREVIPSDDGDRHCECACHSAALVNTKEECS